MNTLIAHSDPPRLGSQARAAHRGEDKERLAGTWLAFIQFVQGVIIPRCARRTPRHSAAALDDGWRTSGVQIFLRRVWSASRRLRGRRFNRQWPSRRSSGSTLANSNPSPWVVRLPHSITCFHLGRHITGLQRHAWHGGAAVGVGFLTEKLPRSSFC